MQKFIKFYILGGFIVILGITIKKDYFISGFFSGILLLNALNSSFALQSNSFLRLNNLGRGRCCQLKRAKFGLLINHIQIKNPQIT